MAISILWDTVQDAEVEQSAANGKRIVRTAFVKGITSSVTTKKLALLDVLAEAGVPAFGESFDALYPQYRCVYRVARGIEGTKGTMARLWVHYETARGGTPIETFAAQDSVTLVATPTDVFPGTATQLRCSLTGTSPDYEAADVSPTDRPITVTYPMNMRCLVLYGLFADRPSTAVRQAANCVNNATWQGLKKGYWRCSGPSVSYSNADGLYRVTVGFLNKGEGPGEDWQTYEVARKPDGTMAAVKSSILEALYSVDYGYGVLYDKNGIWNGGLYQMRNFSSIFGNNFPIGD